MHYLIIGAGAAGLSAAEAIRKHDPKGKITVITKERYQPYSLCALPAHLSLDKDESTITRFDEKWWKDNKISLKLNTEIMQINPRTKSVKLHNGRSLKFDKLLIATGSKPIIPKIPGNVLDGIYTLNSLDDSIKIHERLCSMGDCSLGKAVVIGGGFIGLEASIALKQRGLNVTVIEMLSGVLPKMVDEDINRLIQRILKENGIKIKVNTKVKAILGSGRVESVKTTSGKLKADIMVWCVGVQPNIDLLKKSGIKVKGGVIVNSKMQTNYNDIYAAGDIINSYDLISGETTIHANWPNALEQGAVAGSNMAGYSLEYTGAFNLNVINVFDTPVVSLGLHTEDHNRLFGKSYKSFSRSYGVGNVRKLNRVIFANGKFTGFQSVGWPENIGWITTMLRTGNEVPESEEVKSTLLNNDLKVKPIKLR